MAVRPIHTAAVAVATRTAGRYGIGEVVNLSVTVPPADGTVAGFGGITWRRTGAAGVLSALVPAAGTATLTIGGAPGAMRLEAWSVGLPLRRLASANINVVAPDGVTFRKVAAGTIRHTQGQADAGFIAEADILPSGVSFNNVQVGEGSFRAVASGAFRAFNGLDHAAGPWLGVACTPATGRNHWVANDDVYSGVGAPRVNLGIPVLDAHGNPTFEAASFEWNIPWRYRLVGAAGAGTRFIYMVHKQTINQAGRVSIQKHNSAVYSANLNAPTATYGLAALGYP